MIRYNVNLEVVFCYFNWEIFSVFLAEWSVLYLSVIVFGIAMALIGLTWALCFCFSR